jgi:hypothetical protein
MMVKAIILKSDLMTDKKMPSWVKRWSGVGGKNMIAPATYATGWFANENLITTVVLTIY